MKNQNSLKSNPINNNAAISARYKAALLTLIARMNAETKKELKALFEAEGLETFAQDANIVLQAKKLLKRLLKQFEQLFNEKSLYIAEKLTNGADKHAKLSATKATESVYNIGEMPKFGKASQTILNAIIQENVALIKSIPQKYMQQVQGQVMRSIAGGGGLSTLTPFLKNQLGVQKRRAELIALDQTRKAINHLSIERLKKAGIKQFIWIHSGGGHHPRPLHVSYHGRVFDFDNPPIIDEKTKERGYPSDAINCRCKLAAYIPLDN